MTDQTQGKDPAEPGSSARASGPSSPGQTRAPEGTDGQEDFARMLASEPDPSPPGRGDVVKGTLVQIGETDALVDVGGKSEALIARDELLGKDGSPAFKVGDAIEARVISADGALRISRRTISSLMTKDEAREMLVEASKKKIPVQGRVTASVKGGYEVMVAGVRGFCPFSQIDVRRQEDPLLYFNKTFDFRIKNYDPRKGNLILSRRVLIEAEARKREAAARARLTPGTVVEGKVVSLQDFGAFIDLGDGVQGLLHVSEISRARVAHPKDVLQPGQALEVQVLKHDKKKAKISLTRKTLEADPWDGVDKRYRQGQVLTCRVVRTTPFGAFLELGPGVDGLLHVSELQALRKDGAAEVKPEELCNTGDELKVAILKVEPSRRRISLALADESAKPGETVKMPKLRAGKVVTGKVERVEKFGVFVRLGPGRTGLIPNSELDTPRGSDHRKMFPIGTELTAEITEADPAGRRIRLSVSKAKGREEREAIERYKKDPSRTGSSLSTLADAFAAFKKTRQDS